MGVEMNLVETKIKILEGAKGLIVSKGWCQAVLEDFRGALCILGAIRNAAGESQSPQAQVVWGCYRNRQKEIIEFNDLPSRDVSEILAWFNREIEGLKMGTKNVPAVIASPWTPSLQVAKASQPSSFSCVGMSETIPAFMINPIADIPLHV